MEETIHIPNAPWWEAHSRVLIKEDFTAGDEAWINNQVSKLKGAGSNKPSIDMQLGNIRILTVQRMVVEGVVAVKRRNGRVKTVQLPQEVERLLKSDIDYIMSQIDEANPDMTEEEQTDFLDSAKEHSETSLKVVK